jgi:ribosomal protein L40E
MICRHCKAEIADKALICYRCGNATAAPRLKPPAEESLFDHRRRSPLPIIVIVLILILAILAAWLFELLPVQ